MDLAQRLAQERRARLAAERLLVQKQNELSVANRELSKHARALSVQVIEKREEAAEARSDLRAAQTQATLAERRLWTSLSTIQDGFAVFDQHDVLVAANAAWLRPFEGASAVAPGALYSDILTVALEEGMIDIGFEDMSTWRARMLDRWHAPRIEPVTIRLWTGAYLRLVDRRGDGGDVVTLALDITKQMRNEARLRDARGRAEAASRAKSAFLANMSHELRTPMNGIVGMADLLAETALDDDQRSCVDSIRNSGEALLVIINDILDVSKIDAQKMVLHPVPFDLERSLQEVVQLMQPMLQDRPVRLLIDYDMFLPTRFEADAGRVRQIFTNLIGNAVKFTNAGQVLVRVTGTPDTTEGWIVHVAVEDTGIGIAADKLRHVFGEFNQVEDERNRKYQGTGLGLAITDRLVKLMGGDLWVDSMPGRGSCFGFRIRMAEADAQPLPAPRHVLLLDPDATSANLLRSQLMALGMQVSLHRDAASALADLPRDTGLVLAAERLPDMSVRALAQALLGAGLSAPLLALTHGSRDAAEFGLIGTLARPISRRDLIATLTGLPLPSAPGQDNAAPPAAAAEVAPAVAEVSSTAASAQGDGMATAVGAKSESSVVAASDPAAPTADRAPANPVPPGPATRPGPTPSARPDSALVPVPIARNMRVLAAEDNRTNRLVLCKMLGKLDIDLRFAENGQEAVEMQEAFQPDLIFMDISMPVMDGKEATRRIRAAEAGTGRHTPIVALTAHALNGDAAQILAAGLDFYLTKPLRRPAILDRIRDACPPDCRPIAAAPDALAAADDRAGAPEPQRSRLAAAE